jgi:hypothetical protein
MLPTCGARKIDENKLRIYDRNDKKKDYRKCAVSTVDEGIDIDSTRTAVPAHRHQRFAQGVCRGPSL